MSVAATFRSVRPELQRGPPLENVEDLHKPNKNYWDMHSDHAHEDAAEVQQERLLSIAQAAGDWFENMPRIPPSESLDCPAVKSTHLFLKKIDPSLKEDPRIARLAREFLAFKLGVPSDVFEKNIGFEKFAYKPPLDRYLAEYGHTVKVGDKGEIELLENGKYRPWSELRSIVAPAQGKDPSSNQPWYYGPLGVQNKNMFEWTKLEPYKKEDPKQWDNQYILEVCCCCEDEPRYLGDHSWLRLKDPEGNIYSVGFYRPYNYVFPVYMKKGILMQPDVSEFWPTPIYRLPIAISKEQFLQMKETIETDKKKDRLIFRWVEGNCTFYVEKIAHIAGICLPTEKPAWRVLMPSLERKVDWISPWVADSIQNVCAMATACVMNLGLLLIGTNQKDSQVASLESSPSPRIETFSDLFDYNKIHARHPHTLAHQAQKAVMDWRTETIAELQKQKELLTSKEERKKIDEQIAKTRFDLPPSMRLRSP